MCEARLGKARLCEARLCEAQRQGERRSVTATLPIHHDQALIKRRRLSFSAASSPPPQAGLWPYTGKATNTGSGQGHGATINIPLPGGAGDAAMRAAFSRIVEPAARRFAPDAILVSAGYDAHALDPLASMQLHAGTYHWMSSRLAALARQLCGGRLLLVLEGGYHLASLAESVTASARGLVGLQHVWTASTQLTPPPGKANDYGGAAGRSERDEAGGDAAVPSYCREEPTEKVEQVLQQVARLHGL